MKKWIKENYHFIFGGFVLICIIIIILLYQPEGSLFKEIGKSLGKMFGDVVEGFKEGMKK